MDSRAGVGAAPHTPLSARDTGIHVSFRGDNPYRTVLADRDIDPAFSRMLVQHLKLGAGVGFLAAGLAMIWLFLVGAVAVGGSGFGFIVIIAPVAAACGAVIGTICATLFGLVLWPTLALRLGRYVYPAAAGLIQGRIMYGWTSGDFDPASAAVVWVGSILIAVVIASRWTAAALVELSRYPNETAP